jgi:hypothetical protein
LPTRHDGMPFNMMAGAAMPKLFISYRREDSLDIAGRIHDRLAGHFGHDVVFMDVDTIPFGVDFRSYLTQWVNRCDLVIAVVGKGWLESRFESGPKAGKRRLEDPADFVRIEIAADFAFRSAAEVRSGRDFHGHMDRLIRGLEHLLEQGRLPHPDPLHRQEGPQEPPRPAAQPCRQGAAPAIVTPPEVAMPTNLGFEGSLVEGMPFGWSNSLGFVGGVSLDYDVRVLSRKDPPGGRCVRMQRADARAKEFGSLMQRCPAQGLVGKRIRLEAELRAEIPDGWAGLWLRLDGPSGHLFFDNMHDRPIRGSTPWAKYSIETRVPEGSEWMNFGILLVSNGSLWADNFALGGV